MVVHIDFPRRPVAKGKVQDPARNERLQEDFQVEGYPTVILTDKEGRLYATADFEKLFEPDCCAYLIKLQNVRSQRDELFGKVAAARETDRLQAALRALDFLERYNVVDHYGALLKEWAKLAVELDPKNERAFAEHFFLAAWFQDVRRAEPNNTEALVAAVDRLDEWRKAHRIKDADRLASTYLKAGMRLSWGGKPEAGARCFKSGLACRPQDDVLVKRLTHAAAGKLMIGSGTGFAVAPNGYFLTNHHVVAGGGRLLVQLRKDMEPSSVPQ